MYVINCGTGMPEIPVTDFTGIDSPDYSQCMYSSLEWEIGTASDPIRIWSGQGGYVDSIGNIGGGLYGIKAKPIDGTEPLTYNMLQSDYIEGTTALFLYAAITGTDLEHGTVTLYWDVANAWSDVGFNSQYDRKLYQDTWANAYGTIVTDSRNWDESPSADENDPTNSDPKGGEFADTDPLGFGNDDIDVPDVIPEISYSGFISAYKLDDGGVGNLGSAIFTTNTWTNLQNKFNGVGDPVSYIISAVEIPYSANPDGVKDFNLGGIKIVDNNNNYVPVSYLEHRYHMLNFGSLTLKETWGTEKDYSGTSVSIYLPYVGVKDLDTAVVMNSTITVKAMLDVWTGDLLYMLIINNKNAAYKYLGSSGIVYRFQGNCGKSIPIGKTDNTTQMLAIAGSIASMGVGLASGLPTGAMGYTVGNEFGASGDVSGNVNPRLVGGGAAGMIGALTMGPKISMAGGVAGAIGRGDYQQPYLIIKQSVPVYPKDWRAHFGAPRYQTFTLGDLNGYVKCADVHAESIEGANDAEREAIEQALKAGVFMN